MRNDREVNGVHLQATVNMDDTSASLGGGGGRQYLYDNNDCLT